MLRFWISFVLARVGLTRIARALNNGHWYADGDNTIVCTCGLESCYWQEYSHTEYRKDVLTRLLRDYAVANMVAGEYVQEHGHYPDRGPIDRLHDKILHLYDAV